MMAKKSPQEEIKRLQDINAAKTDLISISAHQLRTSLAALKWILKMLLDGDIGTLSAEQKNFISKAFDSANRMNVLVNDLLTLNQAEDVSIEYEFTKKNIEELIDNVLFEFTGESHEKGIPIVFLRPKEDLPDVRMDEEKIRVVVQNLLENAIKYSDSDDKIFISLERKDKSIVVSVKDTGIGISEEEQQKIFEKFFRAKNAQEKEKVGSGLGLYTTKKIVEKHGGEIWFKSSSEEGSTFSFSLPIPS